MATDTLPDKQIAEHNDFNNAIQIVSILDIEVIWSRDNRRYPHTVTAPSYTLKGEICTLNPFWGSVQDDLLTGFSTANAVKARRSISFLQLCLSLGRSC